jgi:hypothetical protein
MSRRRTDYRLPRKEWLVPRAGTDTPLGGAAGSRCQLPGMQWVNLNRLCRGSCLQIGSVLHTAGNAAEWVEDSVNDNYVGAPDRWSPDQWAMSAAGITQAFIRRITYTRSPAFQMPTDAHTLTDSA